VDRCVKLRLRFGSRPQSFFEKPDYRQQNDLADNGVNDLCDDAADENKAGQWQKPTCQDDPIMPTTMLNSKTVTLDCVVPQQQTERVARSRNRRLAAML